MHAINVISMLAISFAVYLAEAGSLPQWIVSGITQDSSHYYVYCSSEGLDPEDAKQTAEGKCLSSAAKLGGVTLTLKSKTVQSTTGADTSEVAEIQPLHKNVQCEWTNKFVEVLKDGFRVWLQCKIGKSAVVSERDAAVNTTSKPLPKYKRGILTVATIPRADVIAIGGPFGERVIEVNNKVQQVEIQEGDEWVSARKHGFKEIKQDLNEWSHGDVLNKTFKLITDL